MLKRLLRDKVVPCQCELLGGGAFGLWLNTMYLTVITSRFGALLRRKHLCQLVFPQVDLRLERIPIGILRHKQIWTQKDFNRLLEHICYCFKSYYFLSFTQSTDFHFAKYRFSFRKVQIFISFGFVSQSTISRKRFIRIYSITVQEKKFFLKPTRN